MPISHISIILLSLLVFILGFIVLCLLLYLRYIRCQIRKNIDSINNDRFIIDDHSKNIASLFSPISKKMLSWIYSTLKSSTKITTDVKVIQRSCEVSKSSALKIKDAFDLFDIKSQEVFSCMENLKNTVDNTYITHQNIKKLSNKAEKYAKETGEFIDSGSHSINNIISTLEDMNKHIENVTTISNHLSHDVSSIQDMATLITDLAENINLLSLNASIEAARAGAHGRGFAVVATEINKLADQSSDYANRIMKSVTNISSKNVEMEQAMSVLSLKRDSIHHSITGITNYFNNIQKDSLKIHKAVTDVNQKVEDGLASSDQIKAATETATNHLNDFKQNIYIANKEIKLQLESEERNLAACNTMQQTVTDLLVFTSKFENIIADKLIHHCHMLADLLKQKECTNNDIINYCNHNGISEVYITDNDGVTQLTNSSDGIGFRFPDDESSQAYEFRKILSDPQAVITQNFKPRDLDNKYFKFVAISRLDCTGIVQVGLNLEDIFFLKML